jgi:pimeloyl-ACP methyl ester carboxylesterase
MKNEFARLFVYGAVALILSACGGGGSGSETPGAPPTDPLDSYRNQAVKWEVCDSSILGIDDEATRARWQALGDRVRCANVRVPLDYQNPARGDASVAMLRVSAATPSKRRGAIFFNPGGPGLDGLGLTFGLVDAFGGSNPNNTQGKLQLRLLDEFDMVGFSPRGTGASSRLQCATNELMKDVEFAPGSRNAQNAQGMLYNARKIAEACQKNPLAQYVNSESTAQDMDLMRSLLGDEKLNYVGYSYGTWLGAWYASRFPQRVNRMVLDSSMDFSETLEVNVLMQPPGKQRVLDQVIAPYAARHSDVFNLGSTADEVRTVFPSLSPRVQEILMEYMEFVSTSKYADALVRFLAGARVLDAAIAATPQLTPANIEQSLSSYVFVPSNPAQDAGTRSVAKLLLAAYSERWLNPLRPAKQVALYDWRAPFQSVVCNDTPANTDPQFWIDVGDRFSKLYPAFGSKMTQNPCIYWSRGKETKPPLSAMSALEVMLVQAENDGVTTIEGARNAFSHLPQSREVTVSSEYQHMLYPYLDSCVDTTVTRFLLGESPSDRKTICAGHPLALDRPAAVEGGTPEATSAYVDPERARKSIDRFKEGFVVR